MARLLARIRWGNVGRLAALLAAATLAALWPVLRGEPNVPDPRPADQPEQTVPRLSLPEPSPPPPKRARPPKPKRHPAKQPRRPVPRRGPHPRQPTARVPPPPHPPAQPRAGEFTPDPAP